MRSVAVIGAGGFVGSAFSAHLSGVPGLALSTVTRENYAGMRSIERDVVIDCSGNSRKYLADEVPTEDFDRSVTQRLRTLLDFPARLHVHISSVDVYNDLSSPATTCEDVSIDPARGSRYGFHKWLAEQLVRQYAGRWLIVRLGGMVGPGLRKNPVYDILTGRPLRIHPDSRYQFIDTTDVARIVCALIEQGVSGQVVNVCGDGTVSPRQIAAFVGADLGPPLGGAAAAPRIVDVCIDRLRSLTEAPSSVATVEAFVSSWRAAAGERPAGPAGADR